MTNVKRTPEFEITIYSISSILPTGDLPVVTGVFRSSDPETDLMGYSFSESIKDISASFALTLLPRKDGLGRMWIDKFSLRDIVTISEFGIVRYVGMIRDMRYSARMTENGPQRIISVRGTGIGSLLQTFRIVMDLRQNAGLGTTVEALSAKWNGLMAPTQVVGYQIKNLMKSVYDAYFGVVEEIQAGLASKGTVIDFFVFKKLCDRWLNTSDGMTTTAVTLYPIALSLYRVGENNLWEIMTSIVQAPFYELFGRWDVASQMYWLILRKTPFGALDWLQLTAHSISPEILVEYDLGMSDSEVKSSYRSIVAGSGYDRNLGLLENAVKIDPIKLKLYGYIPMELEFKYYNRQQVTARQGSLPVMNSTSNEMQGWFHLNDEMLSGSVSIMTMVDCPKIGNKLKFLGGEFYIEESSHSWSVGSVMQTQLNLSRGYVYSMGKPVRRMSNLGKRVSVLDSDTLVQVM
jgi:hypothetical protein